MAGSGKPTILSAGPIPSCYPPEPLPTHTGLTMTPIMASLGEFLRGLFDDGPGRAPGPAGAVGGRPGGGAGASSRRRSPTTGSTWPGRRSRSTPPSALAAAELVRQACWFLVSRSEPVEELERRLTLPRPPRSAVGAPLGRPRVPVPAPGPPAGPVDRPGRPRWRRSWPTCSAAWPLSGVLSDLEEGPDDARRPRRAPGPAAALRRAAGPSTRSPPGVPAAGSRWSTSSWSTTAWAGAGPPLAGPRGGGRMADDDGRPAPRRGGRRRSSAGSSAATRWST